MPVDDVFTRSTSTPRLVTPTGTLFQVFLGFYPFHFVVAYDVFIVYEWGEESEFDFVALAFKHNF